MLYAIPLAPKYSERKALFLSHGIKLHGKHSAGRLLGPSTFLVCVLLSGLFTFICLSLCSTFRSIHLHLSWSVFYFPVYSSSFLEVGEAHEAMNPGGACCLRVLSRTGILVPCDLAPCDLLLCILIGALGFSVLGFSASCSDMGFSLCLGI